jgi:hypothetical protein
MRTLSVILLAVGTAIGASPQAVADRSTYLSQLQPKYVYLTAGQLLSEGAKVCRYVSADKSSFGAVAMVVNDLEVSVDTATTIVGAAIVNFDC